MDDAEPTLLLTRPEAQSTGFLTMCEAKAGRRLPVVISPLMRIEAAGDVPDLDRFGTVVVTSGNGVERLGTALAGCRVRTVGKRTARRAREFGAEAQALGENVDGFLEGADGLNGPILIVRGVHARGELAEGLAAMGHAVEVAVLYDQVALPLNTAARGLLTGMAPVVAPVFSPRTAQLLAQNPISAPLRVLAISDAVAAAWSGAGEVRVAEKPDAEAMCELVLEAF